MGESRETVVVVESDFCRSWTQSGCLKEQSLNGNQPRQTART